MDLKQIAWGAGILLALALVFGIWASYTTPAKVETPQQQALAGTLQPNGDYKYSESTEIYTIEASWPEKVPLATAEASAKARFAIEQGLSDEINRFKADSNFAGMTQADIEMMGIGGDRKYALALEYKDYDAPGYHSYAYTVYADTLGAHPNGYFKTFVFDVEGNRVMLADLFDPSVNWLEELSLLVSNDVTAQMKARLGESLPQGDEGPDLTGAIFPEGLSPSEENFQNFVIDGDALVILIPPYQVAAYAAGSFEVRIPFADIASNLKVGVMR
ncbi:MAG: hypothetical protein JWL87_628 [Candidatus Adlerbacteria bacterium]|nr:hypothetical protein [Candidatus Adlerbacteria bacterium]